MGRTVGYVHASVRPGEVGYVHASVGGWLCTCIRSTMGGRLGRSKRNNSNLCDPKR
jgi:hypothetical protein